MSTPVVAIGYLILIPCVFGIIFGMLMTFAGGAGGVGAISQLAEETKAKLIEAGIPGPVAEKAVTHKTLSEDDKRTLSQEQIALVTSSTADLALGQAGTGVAGAVTSGIGIILSIGAFVGGLLGWLLIMKKKVLQCTRCSAVVAAS